MSDFDNLVAIVTGGASGIGAATAEILRSRGARVAILDRTIGDVPDEYLALECDIASTPAIEAAVGAVIDRFGSVDIVINNAGIGAVGDVAANDESEWLRVLDVNVVGLARVSRATLPHLRLSSNAAIVNVSSVVAEVGVPDRALYSASKGAVAAVTRAMAADHVRDGIRVNAVAPGTADTPWVEGLLHQADDSAAAAAALRARQPIGRLVTASEVANAIAYLASPASASTTGTLLSVDGGMGNVRLS